MAVKTKKKEKSKKVKESDFNYKLKSPHDTESDIVYPQDSNLEKYLFKLPFGTSTLLPYLSPRTVYHHYTDHHLGYYKKFRAYIDANDKYKDLTIEQFLRTKDSTPGFQDAVINGILLRNHNFYWQSLSPYGGVKSAKESELSKDVVKTFGSVESFKKKFTAKAMKIGIGWIWLFNTDKGLQIIRTDYLTTPLPSSYRPLLTIDVWEHSYYIDYGNNRFKYVSNYINHMVNWEFAEKNYAKK